MTTTKILQKLKIIILILLVTTIIMSQTANAFPIWGVTEESKHAAFVLPIEDTVPMFTQNEIKKYLSKNGYSVDIFRVENVTVELMKHVFSDYDIIIMKTFKNDYEQEYALLTGEKIVKGNIKYEEDIAEGRISIGYYYTYELTEDFFDYYYDTSSLEGKLIYIIAPKSTFILNVLSDKGARISIGYSKDVSVSWGWCDLIAEYFFRYLSYGYTAGESIKIINRRLFPVNNYVYSRLALTYMGDASFELE